MSGGRRRKHHSGTGRRYSVKRSQRGQQEHRYSAPMAVWQVARGCTGKAHAYATKGMADDAAVWVSRQVGHRVKSYACRFCTQHHLMRA